MHLEFKSEFRIYTITVSIVSLYKLRVVRVCEKFGEVEHDNYMIFLLNIL